MRIEDSIKLDYSDVLIRPKRSTLTSRKEVDLHREFRFRHSNTVYHGIPIMAANMDYVGTFSMARALDVESMFTCINKHYDPSDWKRRMLPGGVPDPCLRNISISTGISEDDFKKTKKVVKTFGDQLSYITVDVANGYSEAFVESIKRARDTFKDKVIIAGNVVTADMTEALMLAGADIVKIGIGSGGVCTTRIQTGVGYSQLSAVIECADAAHGLGGHIIADGGVTCPGDIAKAFGAGADFVMLGGLLAGHEEGGGDIVVRDGTLYRLFHGMSSREAQEAHGDSLKGYRASEGKEVLVKDRGKVENTLVEILGGLRSACTYTGSRQLKELPKRTTFVRVNHQANHIFGKESG